jgi:UDPglucose--hexose-1-phosphate uridylyltransferase
MRALSRQQAFERDKTQAYTGAYCFTNDLPTFSNEAPAPVNSDELYQAKAVTGTAEVICYHPDHAKTFVDLTDEEAHAVVALWRERYMELGARPEIEHVLIFENKGSLVGTSNPHPHCQIYAGNLIYGHTAQEVESSRKFFERTGRYLGQEILEAGSKQPACRCRESIVYSVCAVVRALCL